MPKSQFIFGGNIGQAPQLKWQPANERSNGQPRPLLSFTVKYDRLVKVQNPAPGQPAYEDKGGFWIRVDYWKRDAEQLGKLLTKGMQVQVSGELRMDSWEDKDNPGQMVTGMAVTADTIAILPRRIESVTMAVPRAQNAGQPSQQAAGQQASQAHQAQQPGHTSEPGYSGGAPDHSDVPDYDGWPE